MPLCRLHETTRGLRLATQTKKYVPSIHTKTKKSSRDRPPPPFLPNRHNLLSLHHTGSPVIDHFTHENENRSDYGRHGACPAAQHFIRHNFTTSMIDNLQVPNPLLNFGKVLKILTKEASDERQWQEDDGDGGELLHRLILVRGNGVEDEVDEIL